MEFIKRNDNDSIYEEINFDYDIIQENYRNNLNRIILNVGGIKHEVLANTLKKYPNSRLGKLLNANTTQKLLQICDGFYENEYYFDRNPDSFTSILNFYRTGKLHLKDNICILSFQDDLKYWDLSDLDIEVCCQQKYYQKKDQISEEILREENILKMITIKDEFGTCCHGLRKNIWNLMVNIIEFKYSKIAIFFVFKGKPSKFKSCLRKS
jgi:hypothetical protein